MNQNFQNVFNSAQVLVNIAIRAQKAGILKLDEAATVYQAITVQEDYYKELGEQLKLQEQQENTKVNLAEGEEIPLPAEKPKAKSKAKLTTRR